MSRRIIPALAGNTGLRTRVCRSTADHPRSRGEYNNQQRLFYRRFGSSPLSRGIQVRAMLEYHREGIIPALAGNTEIAEPTTISCTDHPRSRGEYWTQTHQYGAKSGSSPLSRGILI